MEYLTPTVSFDIFMDNYFTCFRLLTHFGVNNIPATGVLNKRKKVYSRTKTKSILLLQPEYGFFNRMDQNVAKYRTGIRMKKWWWSPFV